jgi:hypothetical protein
MKATIERQHLLIEQSKPRLRDAERRIWPPHRRLA